MHQTYNNEAFLFVSPRSQSLILLLPERHTLLLKSSIFDSFWRITIFSAPWQKAYRTWSKPQEVKELGKTERRPPTREIIPFLIAYRQPPPPEQLNLENSNFIFLNLQNLNFRKLRTLNQIPNFSIFGQTLFDFGLSLLFKEANYYSKTERRELQAVHQYLLKLLNKLLVSRITTPGRVHLAKKLC